MKNNKTKWNIIIFILGLGFLGGAIALGYFGVLTLARYDVSVLDQDSWPESLLKVFKLLISDSPMLFASVLMFMIALICFIINTQSHIMALMIFGSIFAIVATMGVLSYLGGIVVLYFEPKLLWYLVSLGL